jgi:hypothetical protein
VDSSRNRKRLYTARRSIAAIVDELARLRDRGELTPEAFADAFDRAVAAVIDLDDDEERRRLLDPVLDFGALVGCMRE